MSPNLQFSPLDAVHRAAGAKMVPFGGWDMPLAYESGTVTEHLACRNDAVMFDVSHLGSLRVTGPGAFAALQWAFTNDLNRIEPGRAQYTHLLDAGDGSVLDDIIVWWIDDDTFDVMPNASNTDRVADALGEVDGDFTTEDVTSTRAVIAVQGPNARTLLAGVSQDAAAVGRFRVGEVSIAGASAMVAGTGYTGEDGVEIAVPTEHAADVWDALAEAGVRPAGLGARDTLRLEAGLPLHGQELGPGITSAQAGLSWVVRPDKGSFRGDQAVADELAAGLQRRLHGLRVDGRRPPRTGQPVLIEGAPRGEVSSGNFSPVLECGVALAFLSGSVELGDEVQIDMRGKLVDATIVKPPFVG